MLTLFVLFLATALSDELDEEIVLKEKLFGPEGGPKKYDSNVIQNRWRKTTEKDLRVWSTN